MNFKGHLEQATLDELRDVLEYARQQPEGNKTRITVLERRVRKLKKAAT